MSVLLLVDSDLTVDRVVALTVVVHERVDASVQLHANPQVSQCGVVPAPVCQRGHHVSERGVLVCMHAW